MWGDFELGRLLGRGGMGAVYRGRQISLDRPVAIKVLPPHLGGNEDFRKRFLLEAKAVAQISSPHVVQVYAAGVHEAHHYFAMEFVEGEDLSHRLRHGYRPSAAEALELVIQAARGLAAAGELGIVHRDIKPGNMMVTAKNQVKLMDFGLVRLARSEDTGLTRAGTIMGTVSYFSPEQGRGERCDQRTDIYALGVVFYELLTGSLPFTGEDATSVIYQHIHVKPKLPRTINPAIPENYQAVVLTCLQKDPAHRYQNAQEMIADLDDLRLGHSPRTAFLDTRRLRLGGTMIKGEEFAHERARRFAIAGIVAAVLLAVGGGFLFFNNSRPPAGPPVPSGEMAKPIIETNKSPFIERAKPLSEQVTTPVGAESNADLQLEAVARRHLQASRLNECRTLVEANRTAHPDDAGWLTLAKELERAEGTAAMQDAVTAYARGDYEAATRSLATARTRIPDDPSLAIMTTRLAERAAERSERVKQLDEANRLLAAGQIIQAEELLTRLTQAAPEDAVLAAAMSKIHAQRQQIAANTQALNESLKLGDQALERKDFDAASKAYRAA